MEDRKREVEEKAKQLEQVASLSALIGGFALVAMVEVSIPSTLRTGVNVLTNRTLYIYTPYMYFAYESHPPRAEM